MVIRHNDIVIDRKTRTITHRSRVRQFHGDRDLFAKICYFILNGPSSLEMAFFRFYGDDPNGGPDMGPRVFNVFLNQWQDRFLTKLDLEWRSHKIAGVSFYEIVPKYQLGNPKHFSFSRGKHLSGSRINSRGADV